jgi:hypothetical protein
MSQQVVQAAREVAQIQNRFQNLGGQFASGLAIVEEKNRKRRQAAKKASAKLKKDAIKFSKNFDNSINYLGFTDEETKIIKDEAIKYTNRFYEITGMLNNFQDQTTDQAQALMNERNDIKNWFKNVNNQQKQRVKGQDKFKADNNNISENPQNIQFQKDAETVNTRPFTSLSTLGEFQWDQEDGRVLKLEDGYNYMLNPEDLHVLIKKHNDKAVAKNTPFTSGQIDGYVAEFENEILDKNVFAAFTGDPRMQVLEDAFEAASPGIISRFEEAFDSDDPEDYKAVAEEISGLYRNYLTKRNNKHVAEVKAMNPPKNDGPKKDSDYITKINKSIEDGLPVKLGVFTGDFVWKPNIERFVKVDSSGNVIFDANGKPVLKVSLEDIADRKGNVSARDLGK